MASDLTARVRTATTWSIGFSVLITGAGLVAIVTPMIAGVAATALVAWLLLFCALHLALAWRSHSAGSVVWEILLGLAYGAIGFYVLARPLAGLATLTLAVAFYLLVAVSPVWYCPSPCAEWLCERQPHPFSGQHVAC